VTLFDRDRRRVQLTEAGKLLLPVAVEILERWAEGARTATAAGRSTAGMRVGLQTAVGRGLTAALGDGVRFRQFPWSDPTAGLASGEVDVAFVWLPLPDPDRFGWQVVHSERRWVLTSVDHPLAATDPVSFDEICDEPFVALPPDAGVARDYWLANEARVRPATISAEAATIDEKIEAVAAGVGICLIAEGNVQLYQRPDVTARPVTDLSPAQLAIAWNAHDTRAAIDELVRSIVEASNSGEGRETSRGSARPTS
jgi:DNA-binding transcriptional LysR family regulator